MRNPSSAFRTRLLAQGAFVAAIAGLNAGCSSDATRIHEPFFTGSTQNQQAIIGGASGAQPMPGGQVASGAVTSNSLPPPPGMQTASAMQPMPMGASAPLPPPPAPVGSGPMAWSAVGGNVVTAAPGDTLASLSARYGVPVVEISRANGGAQVTPGKVIVIPVRVAAGSPVAMSGSPVGAAPAKFGGGIHVVESGDTVYSIARQTGARVSDLVAMNNLPSGQPLQVGQKIRIPGGESAAPQTVSYTQEKPRTLGAPPKALGQLVSKSPGADAQAPTQMASLPAANDAAPAPAATPVVPAAVPDPSAAAPATPAPAVANIDPSVDPPSADGTSFRWPVRGRIISGFGAAPNGERNDGINLAVPEGTSVKAAEAGTVIYSGNELAGYGNLVLIRHADGWVSAYAHNGAILVKRGDIVKRGQTIATAGMTGSVTAPQVHFELRKGAKPVNPLDYLAST